MMAAVRLISGESKPSAASGRDCIVARPGHQRFSSRNRLQLHPEAERDAIYEIEIRGDDGNVVDRRVIDTGVAQWLQVAGVHIGRSSRQFDRIRNHGTFAAGGRLCVTADLPESLSVMMDSVVAMIRGRYRDGDHFPLTPRQG